MIPRQAVNRLHLRDAENRRGNHQQERCAAKDPDAAFLGNVQHTRRRSYRVQITCDRTFERRTIKPTLQK
jgi:hypothetical protein